MECIHQLPAKRDALHCTESLGVRIGGRITAIQSTSLHLVVLLRAHAIVSCPSPARKDAGSQADRLQRAISAASRHTSDAHFVLVAMGFEVDATARQAAVSCLLRTTSAILPTIAAGIQFFHYAVFVRRRRRAHETNTNGTRQRYCSLPAMSRRSCYTVESAKDAHEMFLAKSPLTDIGFPKKM